ncbi:hypothetical protein [Hufsiella ginkgonis]|uniref:DUF3194 domain-containing protein n=1 Tax=Hufsiella ginkgonis TaxID=2695274 RepID=A0A7K1XY67_9SPHI|nr:hypothetical protein [Hufsiella ginkgonis]MXV15787.1 hypothetical protein [Hufsiella ginkgonis]
MFSIKTITPVSAETLFSSLKTEFADYVNSRLGSNLAVEFAHVQDIINISFAEVIGVTTFTITVTGDELTLTHAPGGAEHNTALLEQHLTDFLNEKVS